MFFYQGTGEFPGKLQVHPPHVPNFTAGKNQEYRGRTVYRPGKTGRDMTKRVFLSGLPSFSLAYYEVAG